MMKQVALVIAVFLSLSLIACKDIGSVKSPGLSNNYHYVDDLPGISSSGAVNVVVEIPAGTLQKWEVSKISGKIERDTENGLPRTIRYLGYPGNYGMIPGTKLSIDNGGDGDPLDVLVLGSPLERGQVVETKILGVLKLLDEGEQDDKLIAVLEGTDLYNIGSILEIEEKYPGMMLILETWFENYKGLDKIESLGFFGLEEANTILRDAIENYKLIR